MVSVIEVLQARDGVGNGRVARSPSRWSADGANVFLQAHWRSRVRRPAFAARPGPRFEPRIPVAVPTHPRPAAMRWVEDRADGVAIGVLQGRGRRGRRSPDRGARHRHRHGRTGRRCSFGRTRGQRFAVPPSLRGHVLCPSPDAPAAVPMLLRLTATAISLAARRAPSPPRRAGADRSIVFDAPAPPGVRDSPRDRVNRPTHQRDPLAPLPDVFPNVRANRPLMTVPRSRTRYADRRWRVVMRS